MRFATRTFLWSFVPFAALLLGSFWAMQQMVVSTVRTGLRSSLRETQASIARVRSRSELQNSRFLRMIGESATLKAGVQLLLAEPASREARFTVEEQLREISEPLGFDFLVVSNVDGGALAGVMKAGGEIVPMDTSRIHPPQRGFFVVGGRTHQVISVAIEQGDEIIGTLSVGEHFDFSEFTTPAVLARHGQVLKSSIPGVPPAEVEAVLKKCTPETECELKLGNETYLSLPMESIYFGDGYVLRSLQSVDSASGPVQSVLRNVFLITSIAALAAALILSMLSSRSIVEPIARVIGHLRESEKTGVLPEFRAAPAPIQEIQELTESFNHAASAIRDGRERLHRAYVEFVGSLASALDARDRYTAGHSGRVSEYSCRIADALHVTGWELEEIRIGALLHDIGKIGISDSVLQKPGRLSPEEFALIQQHPSIGRRILEGVHGFSAYLPIVELHHENWDGSGYPRRLIEGETPLGARIVHVADAYDAMTTDRPYRSGMSRQQAVDVLRKYAGTQFDARIVDVFTRMEGIGENRDSEVRPEPPKVYSIQNLAEAIRGDEAASVPQQPESREV